MVLILVGYLIHVYTLESYVIIMCIYPACDGYVTGGSCWTEFHAMVSERCKQGTRAILSAVSSSTTTSSSSHTSSNTTVGKKPRISKEPSIVE